MFYLSVYSEKDKKNEPMLYQIVAKRVKLLKPSFSVTRKVKEINYNGQENYRSFSKAENMVSRGESWSDKDSKISCNRKDLLQARFQYTIYERDVPTTLPYVLHFFISR